MHFSLIATFFLNPLNAAFPLDKLVNPSELINLSTASYPSVEQAAILARKLLVSESISTLSTVYSAGERHGLEGQPFGLMGYYADCSTDGSPSLLGMKLSTSFRNAAANNASISLSIREHKPHMFSPISHPRLALMGTLSTITEESEAARVKKCYIQRHPDAKVWSPGNRVLGSYWVQFHVHTVYWVGGFGNMAYIGFIPTDLYKNITLPEAERKRAIEGGMRRGMWGKLFHQGL